MTSPITERIDASLGLRCAHVASQPLTAEAVRVIVPAVFRGDDMQGQAALLLKSGYFPTLKEKVGAVVAHLLLKMELGETTYSPSLCSIAGRLPLAAISADPLKQALLIAVRSKLPGNAYVIDQITLLKRLTGSRIGFSESEYHRSYSGMWEPIPCSEKRPEDLIRMRDSLASWATWALCSIHAMEKACELIEQGAEHAE
jgi:hypothetical protein